jgi:hypothetical protein
MHPVKRHCLSALALAALAIAPRPASATLVAQAPSESWGTPANLVESRLTVKIGAEWLDVEEEAEIQATPSTWSESDEALIVTGTFNVPKGAAITGCMLWNGDTLLMGKLRGKVQANRIFDSLVPPVTTLRPRDPLLVEQVSETVYNMKLYPFTPNGTRRFRIRYLVPRSYGSKSVFLQPLMSQVNGTVPANFRLRLRGTREDLRISIAGKIWPLELPYNDLVETWTGASILWPNVSKGAVRGRIDSGKWKGDFATYAGELPDSVVNAAAIRSETVVLWNWVDPASFVTSYSYSSYRYLSSLGSEVLSQANLISQIATKTGSNGGKMGLVADLGLGDAAKSWPLADTSATTFKSMRNWLQGINSEYLLNLVPSNSSSSGSGFGVSNAETAKLRQRFTTDIKKVATLYSADSGVIRHLVVVTAGISASSATPEDVDPTLLPKNVSVVSSRLVSQGYTSQYVSGVGYVYSPNKPLSSTWPGIDLDGLAAARPGSGNLADWNGIPLPKVRNLSTARLSIKSGSGAIKRNVALEAQANGKLRGSLNVHASSLEKSVLWEIFDDSGRAVTKWTATPSWTDVKGDSVFPRIWGKSEKPVSPVFGDQDLGPLFGFVDPFHSLLATPSDTVGARRQIALKDSGVPFLTWADIFPRQGYGTENPGNGNPSGSAVHERAARSVLKLSWMAGLRTLRIDLAGINARSIEIRDLQGRLIAVISAAQLSGLASFDWKVPASLGRGMLLVTVRTDAGMLSDRVMIH